MIDLLGDNMAALESMFELIIYEPCIVCSIVNTSKYSVFGKCSDFLGVFLFFML